MTLEITIVALLILLNGFFALSEMAVVTARKQKLKQMAQDSKRARNALALAEHPERFLSTVQVGITLIGILTGVFGGVTIGVHIADALGGFNIERELALGIGTGVSVALITFASIIFGELVPKRVALLAPERIACAVALPMNVVSRIAAPAVWLLSLTAHTLLRLLGLRRGDSSQISEEEIRLLVAESHEQGVIDADERKMVNRVLSLGDRTADSLMTPRTRIAWLDVEATQAENLEVMREHRFSRYPVMRGSDKEVVGVMETKLLAEQIGADSLDLFGQLRSALFVAESTRALNLLETFRDEQQPLALVVDEYGDIAGMITISDLMGAVLGRVQSGESASIDPLVVQRADGSWLVDGSLPTEDLRELLALNRLPDDDGHDYHTVAGLVIARYGRIPSVGEHFQWQQWRFEVVDLDGPRIDKLLIAHVARDDESEAA